MPFFSAPRFYSNPDENVPFGGKDKEAFYVKTSQPINDTEFTKVLEANGNMNDELEKWVRSTQYNVKNEKFTLTKKYFVKSIV